jgi:hypothetical protein
MDMLKTPSESMSSPKQPNTDRRSFIRKTGSALSAVLAAVAAYQNPSPTKPAL